MQQAVITVVGSDKVGILAGICTICAEAQVNVREVTQTILGGMFAMIMVVDVDKSTLPFEQLAAKLREGGQKLEVDVNVTRQEIFDAMHRI